VILHVIRVPRDPVTRAGQHLPLRKDPVTDLANHIVIDNVFVIRRVMDHTVASDPVLDAALPEECEELPVEAIVSKPKGLFFRHTEGSFNLVGGSRAYARTGNYVVARRAYDTRLVDRILPKLLSRLSWSGRRL